MNSAGENILLVPVIILKEYCRRNNRIDGNFDLSFPNITTLPVMYIGYNTPGYVSRCREINLY